MASPTKRKVQNPDSVPSSPSLPSGIPEDSPIAENIRRQEALADINNPGHGYFQADVALGILTNLVNAFDDDDDIDLVHMKKSAQIIAGHMQKFMFWVDRMYWNATQEYIGEDR